MGRQDIISLCVYYDLYGFSRLAFLNWELSFHLTSHYVVSDCFSGDLDQFRAHKIIKKRHTAVWVSKSHRRWVLSNQDRRCVHSTRAHLTSNEQNDRTWCQCYKAYFGGNLEILNLRKKDITKNRPFYLKQTVSKLNLPWIGVIWITTF